MFFVGRIKLSFVFSLMLQIPTTKRVYIYTSKSNHKGRRGALRFDKYVYHGVFLDGIRTVILCFHRGS